MKKENLTIAQINKGLLEKKFSALELTKEYLNKIKKQEKEIFAFVSVMDDSALSQAKEVDRLISKKQNISILMGVPLAIKDNILIESQKTTCSSKILEKYISPYSATCIKKLKKLGAIILGKTNLDEFAMGASTENSAFFTTKNPKDLKRVSGGSSGGSAAAVAADLCCAALGSDTGGSIRQPASFCGVVGLKPTYGAVSRYGLVAFGSSLDQIGPITKTIEDARILFEAIKGKDPKDSTSIELTGTRSLQAYRDRVPVPVKGLKIGVPKEYFVKGIDNGVKKAIEKAIKKIESKGAKIKEISLPNTEYAIPAYYIIATSEASSNLARFDGVKYGLSEKGENLLDVYLKTKSKGFGQEVKRRIMLGTYSLSSGYYDAFYLKAQKVRTLIKNDFDKAFLKVDVIFAPVAPTTAFEIGEKISDPLSMYLSDIYTVSANLAGIPAASIPVGLSDGLPVGLQLVAKPFEEEKIFEISRFYEEDYE